MATEQNIIDFILEQISSAGTVRARKMFGEYAIYCSEKVVALVCDDQLYIKPTTAGRDFIGDIIEAQPYPGAKAYFLIPGEEWDKSEWLSMLVRITAAELPLPKKKAPRKGR